MDERGPQRKERGHTGFSEWDVEVLVKVGVRVEGTGNLDGMIRTTDSDLWSGR
jgi:hypothetical protein